MYLQTIATIISVTLYNANIISAWEQGVATYYTYGDGQGNSCGNPAPPYHFAATGEDLWNWAYGCGGCYQIRCIGSAEGGSCGCTSSAPITVQVIDRCSECRTGNGNPDFDLRGQTRDAISNCGKTLIEYQRVDCSVNGNIMIQNKGSNHYWVGLYAYNIAGRGSLNGIKLRSNSGEWYECAIEAQNFWLCNAGNAISNNFPYDIIFINDQNNEKWAKIWAFSGTIDTGVQF